MSAFSAVISAVDSSMAVSSRFVVSSSCNYIALFLDLSFFNFITSALLGLVVVLQLSVLLLQEFFLLLESFGTNFAILTVVWKNDCGSPVRKFARIGE